MIIEHGERGKPKTFECVCVACGLIYGDKAFPSGMQAANAAIDDGWSWRYGDFYCPDEGVPKWAPEIVPKDWVPAGAAGTEYRCWNCGTKTIKKKKTKTAKCRKCTKLLWPEDAVRVSYIHV